MEKIECPGKVNLQNSQKHEKRDHRISMFFICSTTDSTYQGLKNTVFCSEKRGIEISEKCSPRDWQQILPQKKNSFASISFDLI